MVTKKFKMAAKMGGKLLFSLISLRMEGFCSLFLPEIGELALKDNSERELAKKRGLVTILVAFCGLFTP